MKYALVNQDELYLSFPQFQEKITLEYHGLR